MLEVLINVVVACSESRKQDCPGDVYCSSTLPLHFFYQLWILVLDIRVSAPPFCIQLLTSLIDKGNFPVNRNVLSTCDLPAKCC